MSLTDTQKRNKMLVEALRSDEYKQGRKQLRKGDTFCCLGVACDLYAKETGKGEWKSGEFGRHFFTTQSDSRSDVAPSEVGRWYGWNNTEDPPLKGKRHAAALNDEGVPFEEIANYFEDKYVGDH